MTADNSVFRYSNANDIRVTQDLNSFGEIIAHAHCSVDEKMLDASKNIFRVYHIRIIAPKQKWFTRHETDIFPNNHCQEYVRAYLNIHDCFIFSSRGHDQQSSEQNNRKLISLHNNGEDVKHANGFADF